MKRYVVFWGLLIAMPGLGCTRIPAIAAPEKTRVIVLTDVANEPDDERSFIRLLLYSNEFDIECIRRRYIAGVVRKTLWAVFRNVAWS